MSDTPFVISPAGFIADVNWATPQPAVGSSINVKNPLSVVPLLQGAHTQLRGVGEREIACAGVRGTIEVQITTGTPSLVGQGIVYIGATPLIPPVMALALDASNRPLVIFSDALGTWVGQTTPAGAPIDPGTPLRIRFAWDSTRVIWSDNTAPFVHRHATFSVNGQYATAAEWAGTDPVVPWDSFYLGYAWVGQPPAGSPYAGFSGTIDRVQVSPLVLP